MTDADSQTVPIFDKTFEEFCFSILGKTVWGILTGILACYMYLAYVLWINGMYALLSVLLILGIAFGIMWELQWIA